MFHLSLPERHGDEPGSKAVMPAMPSNGQSRPPRCHHAGHNLFESRQSERYPFCLVCDLPPERYAHTARSNPNVDALVCHRLAYVTGALSIRQGASPCLFSGDHNRSMGGHRRNPGCDGHSRYKKHVRRRLPTADPGYRC